MALKAEQMTDGILVLICLLLRFSDPTYIWTKGRVSFGFKENWFSWLILIVHNHIYYRCFYYLFIKTRPFYTKWCLYVVPHRFPAPRVTCTVISSASPQPAPRDMESREVQIDTAKSTVCLGSASKLVRSEHFLTGGLPCILGQQFCSLTHFLLLMCQLQVARKMSQLWHLCSDVPGHDTLILFRYQPGSFEQWSYVQ